MGIVSGVAEQEGTIHFDYSLEPGDPGLAATSLAELRAWRSILRDLDLLGEHPDRYGGYGYGNMSCRLTGGSFVITASQTSGATRLRANDLVRIEQVDLAGFHVRAIGCQPPSSESLTHAMIYAADAAVSVVFHVHSPTIWHLREVLDLPSTPGDVAYGSPAMARAVAQLMRAHKQRPLLFATAGHEDGVFAAGSTATDCGALLIRCLARARACTADTTR